ncbi:EEF1A lysine methyltransferase 2 [Centruroides vittatus]|uniref:EEF1A lysine methyltransferase 2 n=1 Tax=Centruroides vittatus TaxID=120091 RepID=UPI0035107419
MEELNPSLLGSRDYWKECYQQELENFQNNGDIGEVWFGEQSVINVVQWLSNSNTFSRSDPILDIGCGNGLILIELAKEGFTNLSGIDYVEEAIHLARAVSAQEGVKISYDVGDILQETQNEIMQNEYKVILDKGTYDTISLSPNNAKENRLKYIRNVYQLLEPEGYFILTSCNWTKEEILSHFTDFELYHHIPSRNFHFGGKMGSNVTSLVLKKVL